MPAHHAIAISASTWPFEALTLAPFLSACSRWLLSMGQRDRQHAKNAENQIPSPATAATVIDDSRSVVDNPMVNLKSRDSKETGTSPRLSRV